MRLPALVIGGGLTGIDTTTEAAAYYPVQVEKFLERWEALGHEAAATLELSLRPRGARRSRASSSSTGARCGPSGRARWPPARCPNFAPLVEKWGGVSLVYRRDMSDSPAYRLNHEEITKFFEEGVRFVEKLSPLACIPDERGALKAVEFERLELVDGELKGTGEKVTLPARSLFVAAGTSPNVTYERERPGSFEIDHRAKAFKSFKAVRGDGRRPQAGRRRQRRRLLHQLPPRRAHGQLLRRQPPGVRGVGRARDGVGQGRRAARRGAVRRRDRRARRRRPAGARRGLEGVRGTLDDEWRATVVRVDRLTPTIVEVIVRAPAAARHFEPGQFFRLQNYEALRQARRQSHARASSWRAWRSPAPGSTRPRGCCR